MMMTVKELKEMLENADENAIVTFLAHEGDYYREEKSTYRSVDENTIKVFKKEDLKKDSFGYGWIKI